MDYKEYYNLLLENKMITPIWKYVLDLIEEEIKDNENKDYYLVIFAIYFSLINDGNITISLNKDVLTKKWESKLNDIAILLEESGSYNEESFNKIKEISFNCINNYLQDINSNNLPSLINDNKFFEIEDNYLYVRKYGSARRGVIASMDRLFSTRSNITSTFKYQDAVASDFTLSDGQEKAVIEGINKSLVITGGPGTGKTTSILFLLIGLLLNDTDNMRIYLIAPSGKAAGRMKESIINGLNVLTDSFKQAHKEIIDKINNLDKSTIHSLLEIDYETNGFKYNKNRRFPENSIFVIDEASMIDVCLFNALLQAIPTSAKVYIMGDKNQLPSVECGAVFGDLLTKKSIQDNVVELDESKRFKKGTKIFNLAKAVNEGDTLPINDDDWKEYDSFEVLIKDDDRKENPIYYYKNHKENVKDKDIVEHVVNKWGNEFFKSLQDKATDLDFNDLTHLKEVFEYSEISKILCAENEGPRGIKTINNYVKKHFIDKSKYHSTNGYYPGMIMMVNKNNKSLDLDNGDSGLLVTFKDDSTIYFMTKKSSNIAKNQGKEVDRIFKLGEFTFYPVRMITQEEIDMAYAITIHKSQGSDYPNILVILPTKKGHPLLNRQIVYTAITRTKGTTYILSNIDRLNESKDNLIVRDTNVN